MNSSSEIAVTTHHLSYAYKGTPPVEVLTGIDLRAFTGSFVSLIGPSGCGKSTILRILAGLLHPDTGEALIGGVSAFKNANLTAYMPQNDLLFPWLHTIKNAVLGAEIAGVKTKVATQRAYQLMSLFGLEGFERSWPDQLSGGMRQRLALLRTFLMPQQVLLLDEPFGALDAISRRKMQQWLQQVWHHDKRTTILVTHDVEEALILSDVVYVLTSRPAKIATQINIKYSRPRPPTIISDSQFISDKMDILEALDDLKESGVRKKEMQ